MWGAGLRVKYAEPLFATFVVLMFLISGFRSAPLIARGMAPVVRPLAAPLVLVGRHGRLPLAAVIAFGVFVALGAILGVLWGVFMVAQPRTCAQVETAAGPVYTCEIGHPYHAQIVELGQM